MGTEDITPDMIGQAAANLRAQRPRPGGLRGFLIRLLEGKDVRQPLVKHRAAGMVVGSMVERTTANTVYVSAPSWSEALALFTRYVNGSHLEAMDMLNNRVLSRSREKVAGTEPVWMVTLSIHEVEPAA